MSKFSKTFTESEKSDICKAYRLAKDPSKQILTLAELNDVDVAVINSILIEKGFLKAKAISPQKFKPVVPLNGILDEKPKKPRHTWTEEDATKLIELKVAGKTNKEIAEYFHCSPASVASQSHKYKYEIENAVESSSKVRECREEIVPAESVVSAIPAKAGSEILIDIVKLLTEFKETFDKPFTNPYLLGIEIGKFTCKVDAMLRRLK